MEQETAKSDSVTKQDEPETCCKAGFEELLWVPHGKDFYEDIFLYKVLT